LLLITPQTVQLAPGSYYLDVDEFTALVAACQAHRHRKIAHCATCHARLRRAADLYRGDFLAGFLPEDAEPFDEWLILTRERLRRQALAVFAHLARYYEARPDPSLALPYAYRQIAIEPWREDAHRQVMRLLATTGQRPAALAHYETCRRVLRDDLGIEPEGETLALYERIKAGESGSLLHPLPPAPRPNLPQQLTPFIGRDAEVARLTELLDGTDYRLITLVGQGGAGKTRLALQAAAAQEGTFAAGICFVPLAGVSTPDLLAASIAQALGFRFEPTEPPEAQLLAHLGPKELLLVLDNFEHLLAGGTPLILALLTHAPQLVLLVTSRERLGLQAEYVLDIAGLPLPGLAADLVELLESGAVQLFVERARQVQARFALSPDNAPSVVDICRVVAGLPLGIVLAAASVRHFPPARIARSLVDNLDFLASSARDAPSQHTSLRAVFNHSWGLLSTEERRVFRTLSVFRGGWEEEAAEQITGASLTTILALADKSLLRQDEAGRFDIHQVLHQYAAEQLALAPAERSATPARHAAYFLQLAEQAAEQLQGADQSSWLARLDHEQSNIRAALDWGHASGEPQFGVRLAGALWRFWYVRGYYQEGQEHLSAALARAERGLPQAEVAALPAAARRPLAALARAYYGAGALARMQGDFGAATRFLDQSLARYRLLEDAIGTGNALNAAGLVAHDQGDFAGARECYSASLAACRASGDQPGIVRALNNLGNLARDQEDYGGAQALFAESLGIGREMGDTYGIALALASMGTLAWYQADYPAATPLLQEGLRLHHARGNTPGMIHCLETLGKVAASQGQAERAARLWGAAAALREEAGAPLPPVARADHERSVAAARATAGSARFDAAWAEGRDGSLEQMVAYAGRAAA
jgi:predicted ATPase